MWGHAKGGPIHGDTPKDLQDLAQAIKSELSSQVGSAVDKIMARSIAHAQKRDVKQETPLTTAHERPTSARKPEARKESPKNTAVTSAGSDNRVTADARRSPAYSTSAVGSTNLSPGQVRAFDVTARSAANTSNSNNMLDSLRHQFPFGQNKMAKQGEQKNILTKITPCEHNVSKQPIVRTEHK